MTGRPTASASPHWAELTGHDRHAACLLAARAGDREALDALVVELTPLVWHVARGQGLGRTEAEDVVQTVWLNLLRNLHKVSEPKALAGWLITTTRRAARRGNGPTADREEPLTDDAAAMVPTEQGLPEPEAVRNDRDRRLWSAFRQLPQRCQELLRLTVLAGRAEYRAVAEALRMPRGSIGPTRGRCLNLLRSLFATEGGSP
ncbi:RNA polymerase sigma factor [Gandjariella thermophila]|uniref:RNA polymerase sigma factor n=1 Tax=Gandjariella thermophila TaxID=1931992 RepID=A0A4D4J8D0_9PSEU|nr:sigma-70 family RNA polymerase sigma factor [Gandjariella thermophila]GDY30227.1 RNA polymerase sigma factor [Gandjariella thermophila]